MPKVMIVDDAQFLRVRLSRLLLENGYEVVEAENGSQAVTTYLAARPDVVLMDITMPEQDGLVALRAIRGADPGAQVVMLTALGQESIVLEAMRNGAKDFVVKPYQPERLLSAIQKALS